MKKLKKLMILFLCLAMIQIPTVPVSAATVTNGWNSAKTSYYKKGKKLTGLQKISGNYYFFNRRGIIQKNKWGKITVNKKIYYYYFGKTGAAYKAKANESLKGAFKIYTIKGKKYGFDACGRRVSGIWISTNNFKAYAFKNNGIYDAAETKKVRSLLKEDRISNTMLEEIKSVCGNPKKIIVSPDICMTFDDGDYKIEEHLNEDGASAEFEVNRLIYSNYEFQFVKHLTTGNCKSLGAFPREK